LIDFFDGNTLYFSEKIPRRRPPSPTTGSPSRCPWSSVKKRDEKPRRIDTDNLASDGVWRGVERAVVYFFLEGF
jgi:hypothetical protein